MNEFQNSRVYVVVSVETSNFRVIITLSVVSCYMNFLQAPETDFTESNNSHGNSLVVSGLEN